MNAQALILPDEKQLSQVMIRRLKTDLVDKDGNPSLVSAYTMAPTRVITRSPKT